MSPRAYEGAHRSATMALNAGPQYQFTEIDILLMQHQTHSPK